MNTKKGPFRPIYQSLLHHPRFVGLSSDARSLWLALKLRLGPSGLDRVYSDELCDIAGLTPGQLSGALEEVVKSGWVESEGNLYWLVDGYDNEPMNQGEKAKKSIERHLNSLRGDIVVRFKTRYQIEGIAEGVPEGTPNLEPNLSGRTVRGERDREEGYGKGKGKVIGGNVGTDDDPVSRPPDFNVLLDWLRSLEVCMRAAEKWDHNTPTWPRLILDRFGPKGVDPKPPALIVSALSDLVRKTSGILHTRSLEAFVDQEEENRK